jgi:molybdate transport system permease protein
MALSRSPHNEWSDRNPLLALILNVPSSQLLGHLTDPLVAQAIRLSMTTTILTTTLAIVAGTPVAYLLARFDFRGRTLIDTLIDLPIVMPPAVAGIALLLAFGRQGLIGRHLSVFGIEIAFTTAAVIMAQSFVAIPLYVKTAAAGFRAASRDLEQAAMLDGAAGLQTFRFITLPLTWSILLTGAIMSWARAMGEFGATIIFAGNYPGRTQTMPLAIYLGFEIDFDVALTLSTILLILSFGVLFVVKRLLHQQIAAMH